MKILFKILEAIIFPFISFYKRIMTKQMLSEKKIEADNFFKNPKQRQAFFNEMDRQRRINKFGEIKKAYKPTPTIF